MLVFSWIVLFVSAIAQGVFYQPATKGHISAWIAACIFLIPFFTVFFIHFCNRPLFSFRVHHAVWLFGLSWYAALTILAEILRLTGHLPHDAADHAVIFRLLMHVGWLSLIPLVYSYRLYAPHTKSNRNA
jgi:hypothetical protein